MAVTDDRVMLAHTRRGTVPVRIGDRDEIPTDAVMIVQGATGERMAARLAAMVAMSERDGDKGSREDGGPTQDRPGRGASEAPFCTGAVDDHPGEGGSLLQEPMRLSAVMFPHPGGEVQLGLVVASDDKAQPGGHDWGALGLPLGAETRLSPVPPADDDVGAALASAGHRLTVDSANHDVMPGDEIVHGASTWLVAAIDRRHDRMTLLRDDGEEREVAFRQTMLEAG